MIFPVAKASHALRRPATVIRFGSVVSSHADHVIPDAYPTSLTQLHQIGAVSYVLIGGKLAYDAELWSVVARIACNSDLQHALSFTHF